MSLARLVLRLSAPPFAAIGLAFLLLPAALAALLRWGAAQPERVRFALVAQMLLCGGLAAALHGAEPVGLAAGWSALRRLRGDA